MKKNDRTTGSHMTPPWVEPGRNDYYIERLTRKIYIHKLCILVSTKRNIGHTLGCLLSALICKSTWGGSKKNSKSLEDAKARFKRWVEKVKAQ